ncbi:CRISPR-associated protein, Csm1 family [Desulforamulus reducens MI-1]|uniref:CRISPR system single-strand-specific deoxyribonuclease Cas10/Csm1 (subtype III-A) n=1 Tax=Desulforamulus reducens (strain ATCC BAA-1160 / DSM 100696 / MI-1) TaxID=349161 RepID=A4J502_DESRM|nr:type III-A CRISPR-associated protein Cas10/Csm1 [Desulforamulus reducens]ABO50155.1 CRISPR-associated protein, Csm1 family [Desulforamulus reducens MI-1]
MIYETIQLAGLLHDIGVFFQRGNISNLNSLQYSEISARLIKSFSKQLSKICDSELLKNLILNQYEDTDFSQEAIPKNKINLTYLISRADRYSSSELEQDTVEIYNYKKRPMDAVFCHLEIGKKVPQRMQYSLAEYRPENGFPREIISHTEGEINKILTDFSLEFKNIVSNIKSFECFYNQLYSLLLKYTWCIPYNTREKIADISLFDHLKTTSAIATCLYQYHNFCNDYSIPSIIDDQTFKFRLLVGDLSGIQSYIFSGANVGAGGVAKRLRARSFILSMLSELISYQIIKSFNLTVANILMASGGKFYILLPNTKESVSRLEKLQQKLDKYLLQEFKGEIALNLAHQELNGNDFCQFGSAVSRLSKKLAVKKKMPFANVMYSQEEWKEGQFIFHAEDTKGLGICKGCEKEFAIQQVEDKVYGPACLRDLKIGQKLPRIKSFALTDGEADIKISGSYGIRLYDNVPSNTDLDIVILNDNKIDPNVSMTNRYMANYVPNNQGITKSFDEICQNSSGVKKLAYFKADVDNLGGLFAFGFKGGLESGQNKDYDSISRVTTFSRMLDLFFSGRVNQLVSNEFTNCYIVFSGGDDLLVVGPWDEIIEFSLKIYQEFRKFVAYNDNITISAGIGLAKSKTPVVKAVQVAEDLLEEAKEKVLRGNKTGRNQVSIFDRTLSWHDFSAAVQEGKRLAKWITEGKLNRSDIWKLKRYDQMFQDFWQNHRVEGLKYQALLAYDIGRKRKENKDCQEVTRWQECLFSITNPSLINLGVITDYALCATRGGNI